VLPVITGGKLPTLVSIGCLLAKLVGSIIALQF
jgi:hypothetical protein